MMHDFLSNNRAELIQRCRLKVGSRPARAASVEQLKNGVPLFLDQLIKTLRIEQTGSPFESREVSGPASGIAAMSEIGTSAAQHGHELLRLGFTVDQVVHDYGDLCQAITDLAHDRDAPFQIDEFRTLNRCLDNAIADAVTEFSYQRDHLADKQRTHEAHEQAGFFAHELRNALSVATLAFEAAKAGNLTLSGATGAVLQRGLMGLRTLIDRSLDDVRESTDRSELALLFSLADFIAEVKHAAELAARVRDCKLSVSFVDPHLAVVGDRDLLYAAVGNLLQNAFKFTRAHTEVTLNVYAMADRVLIDVKDHCGGLPVGSVEHMFRPFTQHSADKSGLGLGLSIARKSVESYGGTLSVSDVPGIGCVFTVSLPRYSMPAA
ncbi:Adaptive-response sensory-kinase SasA (plasmid) [Caballeronia sp. SBC1]|uniref:sensor histidine kinase n=1 Tax=unclassified Caballeronia TaxID=2646786 RepID=UPI0013E2078A|nr:MULTISPECIES: HAMP domain-containing sensor histidine kinase [unclassified Caballeronia]QIE27965.1 Adaptive-response sensory-kinase SasA [Caballeronia sp. SBC2]QIN66031.1 Adaptive-response sensory-kinase SasA [Caballeronia sp. SBC1]